MYNDELLIVLDCRIKELKGISEVIKKDISVLKQEENFNYQLLNFHGLFHNMEKLKVEVNEIILKLNTSIKKDEEQIIKSHLSIMDETVNNLILKRKKEIDEIEILSRSYESLDNELEKVQKIIDKIQENIIPDDQKSDRSGGELNVVIDGFNNSLMFAQEIQKNINYIISNQTEPIKFIANKADVIKNKINQLSEVCTNEIGKIKLTLNFKESLDNEFVNLKNFSNQIKDYFSSNKQKDLQNIKDEIEQFELILNEIQKTYKNASDIGLKLPEYLKELLQKSGIIKQKANKLSELCIKKIEQIKLELNLNNLLEKEFENLKNLSNQVKEYLVAAKQKVKKKPENELTEFNKFIASIHIIFKNVNQIASQIPDFMKNLKNRANKIIENTNNIDKVCNDRTKKIKEYIKQSEEKAIQESDPSSLDDFGKTYSGLENIIQKKSSDKTTFVEDFGKTFEGL